MSQHEVLELNYCLKKSSFNFESHLNAIDDIFSISFDPQLSVSN